MEISAKDVMALREATGAGVMDCKRALAENNCDFDASVKWLREKGMAKAVKRAGKVASEGAVVSTVINDGKTGAVAEVNCETDFVARGAEFRAFADTVCGLVAASNPADVDALLAAAAPGGGTVSDLSSELTGKCGEKVTIRRFTRFETADGTIATYIHMGGKYGVLVEAAAEGVCPCNDDFRAFLNDICLQICASAPRWIQRGEVPASEYEAEKEVYVKQAMESGKPEAICVKIAEGKMGKWFSEVCLMEQPFVRDADQTIAKLADAVSAKIGGKITIRRFVRYALGEGIEKPVSNLAEEVAAELAKSEGK